MPRLPVQRSIQIHASPEKVFATVADFGTWTTWSPWLCAEPDAEVTVTSDAASVGSVYSWNGELVGQGEIEHRRLQTGRQFEQELRLVKPFRSTSQVSFEIVPAGEGTEITWQMRGSYVVYQNCPKETAPAALLTVVVLPLKSSAPRR